MVDTLTLVRAGVTLAIENPLKSVRLNLVQKTVAQDRRPRVLWRDGNQFLGKSFYLAWEILHRLRGTHPYKPTHRPPIRALVVSFSLEQMMPLMQKIWDLCPKNELAEKCGFDPGRGITGKPPRLVFESGPGKGSVLTFATYKQGAKRVAGGTFHVVALDEPPTEMVYGEVVPRVARLNGDIIITMTPTPDMPDVSWLRKLVEEGQVGEHNFGVKAEHCLFEGARAPYATREQIDSFAASLLPHERAMRVDGAWEPLVTGRWLTTFTRDTCVVDARPPKGWTLAVGIDHGAAAGKQATMLIAVSPDRDEVYFWDEVQSDGYTTPDQDAHAVLDMLKRNGVGYDDVDEWLGDRPTGENKFTVAKSNADLMREMARILRRGVVTMKRIRVPSKKAGSVAHGLRLMRGLFGSGRAKVNSRCVRFIIACERFAGDSRDPVKDILDAGRYPTEALVHAPSHPAFTLHI
jgi:phage terminase large subunit-like protein